MAAVTLQMGHVGRKAGSGLSLGAAGEQDYVKAIVPRVADRLRALGHDVAVIDAVTGAASKVPGGTRDVFVSFHCDGSVNPAVRGASVGYPDGNGQRLAAAWKAAHARNGWPSGYRGDNYTAGLRSYYMWSRTKGHRHRFLAEHGFISSPADRKWLWDHIDAAAGAHVDAIGEIVGHPRRAPAGPTPGSAPAEVVDLLRLDLCAAMPARGTHYGVGVWIVHADGGVFAEDGATFYGSVPGLGIDLAAENKIIDGAAHPSGRGYWLLGADGAVYSFGMARYAGGGNTATVPAPPAGLGAWRKMVAHDDGNGYTIVRADRHRAQFRAPA